MHIGFEPMTSGTPCQSSTTELIHPLIKTSTFHIFIAEDEGLEPPRRFKRPTLFKSAAISPTWLNPPYFNTKS